MTNNKFIDEIRIRKLQENDLITLAETFCFPWTSIEASMAKWHRYYDEQVQQIRIVYVVEEELQFIGYASLLYNSDYPLFSQAKIPEIHDVWIADSHRRRGLGKKLISYLEDIARQEGYKTIGIGVGLYKDYGAAQNLYVQIGYAPDGNGITYKSIQVVPGEQYPVDDDLIFWLTKGLN